MDAALRESTRGVPLDLTRAYRTMLTIRRFEERCLELRAQDAIAGSLHPALGQEAIPTGALQVLRREDRVLATYRGHGWAIACGVPPRSLFAEVLGRETGTNGGRGGSPYLSSPAHGFLGENSIVGAGVPVACGVALAARSRGAVVLVSFGDGATSEGAVHEGLVTAAAFDLPVVFVCENNRWSENTPIDAIARVPELAVRAAGYGMPGVTVDGDDPAVVAAAIADAAVRARTGGGPTFVECATHRLGGHYNADPEHYRTAQDRERAVVADPIPRLRAHLIASGNAEAELERLETMVADEIAAAAAQALDDPLPRPETAGDHVVAQVGPIASAPASTGPTTELTYAKAVNEALRRELEARPELVVFGEDVAIPGGVFGVTRGLAKTFGRERVFDTPIAESAILGTAIGAAQEGLRPVVEIMWSDFLLVALDQLVNQAANVRYLHRGDRSAPMVVRCQQGVTPGSCAQHSQSLEALLAHIPGLHVGMPSNPQDAYAMTRAAIASPDPVILIECRALYTEVGDVTLDAPTEPTSGARTTSLGTDLAIVTWGRMTGRVLEAAQRLAAGGTGATVVELRWLTPLDRAAVAAAARACSRVLVVHEANLTAGFGAEVVSAVVEESFFHLDAPPRRLGVPDVRIPSAVSLQDALLPSADTIIRAADELVRA